MKILTWNINGIRAARRDKSLKEILDSLEADIICLQETKVTRESIHRLYWMFCMLSLTFSSSSTTEAIENASKDKKMRAIR